MIALGGFALGLFGLDPSSPLLRSAPPEQIVSAAADEVHVVDGETLRLGGRTFRLVGLEAPGRGTRCGGAEPAFDCGAAAAAALARLVAEQEVTCRLRGRDRAGHGLGLCEARATAAAAAAVELSHAMVAGGWAVARDDAPPALRPAESEARRAGRGLWAGDSRGWPDAWRGRR
nr:thermonuclease family protein [Caldovatus aquaticus]